ncbi:MAG: amino acid permease [Rubrobacteraceae bacterium]
MAEAGVERGAEEKGGLRPGLKRRHMTMISLGGVIGAGLFVGSGAILNAAGPAAFLTYTMTGVVVVLIMRMLGEMAVAQPSVGSFSDYSRMALGNWAGFSIGWLYWYFWVIVVGVEAVAGAGILKQFIPGVPLWVLALAVIVVLTLTNLYSVKSYGEFEFWFASIKVVAIIIFIVLGTLFVFGLWPGTTTGFSGLYANGGFAPHGPLAVFSGITTTIFAFVGAEVVTIAAAESEEPERGVAKATNQVVYRVLLFYVLSIFLVAAIVNWKSSFTTGSITSPFAVALGKMGIPEAATIMNLVVLTAVLSVLNSSLYITSRMLFALTRHNDAPGFFTNTTRNGVPIWAILAGTGMGYVSVLISYFFPKQVFNFLLNSSGVIALFVYLLIAISELVMRRRLERESPDRLQVKMWLYPYLTIFSILAIVAVLVSMYFTSDGRPQLLATLASIVVIIVAYFVRRAYGAEEKPPDEVVRR